MINVLSLFDGLSCAQIALQQAGIKVDKYYAAEIDKHAIEVTMANYPNTIQLGSVTDIKANDLEKIDLIMGGSPCTGFSFAGKGLNFKDPQSKLFFEYVRILNECRELNPNVKFLLENVGMKKEHLKVISDYLGVFPVVINSNLLSAQNRHRNYWCNFRTKDLGLFSEYQVTDIPQPKDKGILLKDILESEIDKKYYLSDKAVNGLLTHKADQKELGRGFGAKLHKDTDKMNALKVGGKGIDDVICVAMRGRNPENRSDNKVGCLKFGRTDEGKKLRKESMKKGKDHTPFQAKEVVNIDYDKMNTITTATVKDNLLLIPKTEQRLEPQKDGKTNCLTSVSKDNLIMTPITEHKSKNGLKCVGGITKNKKWLRDGKNLQRNFSQGERIYSPEGKSPTLGANSGGTAGAGNTLIRDYRLRRLTPLECRRLQTIPEWYKFPVSDTQVYKQCGNGWTIDVITHILSFY